MLKRFQITIISKDKNIIKERMLFNGKLEQAKQIAEIESLNKDVLIVPILTQTGNNISGYGLTPTYYQNGICSSYGEKDTLNDLLLMIRNKSVIKKGEVHVCHAKKLGEEILQLTDNVNKLLEEYNRQLSNLDTQISDILHFIENENFNAAQGYKYARKLKQLREERRKVKIEMEPLRMLNATTLKNLHPLKCALGEITKKDKELQKCVSERKYIPRAITKEEVFLQ